MTVHCRPWTDIVEFYRSLQSGDGEWLMPMTRFVEQISTSAYGGGLYGYTSMTVLGIAQTSEVVERQERLLVRYKIGSEGQGRFQMALTDALAWLSESPPTHRGQESWFRECSEVDAFPTFEKFVKHVGWLPSVVPGAGC